MLSQVIEAHGEDFDEMNVATAFHELAKVAGKKSKEEMEGTHVHETFQTLVGMFATFLAWGCCTKRVAFKLIHLRKHDFRFLVSKLKSHVEKGRNHLQSYMKPASQLNKPSEEDGKEKYLGCETHPFKISADMAILGRRRYNARHLTSIIQSAAQLKYDDEDLMDKLSQNLLTRMDKLDAIEVTDLVSWPTAHLL